MDTTASGSSRTRYCLLYAGFVIIGGVLGILIALAQINGTFIQWHEIDPPKEGPVDLTFKEGDLYFETEDGILHQAIIDDSSIFYENAKSEDDVSIRMCDYSSIPFSFTNRPPKNITACMHFSTGFEGVVEEVYAIDSEGRIWLWKDFKHGFEFFIYPVVYLLLGTIAGSILAAIWAIVVRKKEKATPTQKSGSTLAIRWMARIWSIVSILLVIASHAFDLPGSPIIRMVVLLLYMIGLCGGLIIAWWRELAGGLIAIGSFIFYIIVGQVTGNIGYGLIWFCTQVILVTPAFLFLLSWFISRDMGENASDEGGEDESL